MTTKHIFGLSLVFALGLLCSCRTAVLITSSEQDAKIFVDGRQIGSGSSADIVKVKKNTCASIKVEKTGYLTENLSYCYSGTNLFAQKMTVKEIEEDLRKNYSKILYWKNYSDSLGYDKSAWDSCEHQNKIFREKIEEYTSKYPLTLDYKFYLLSGILIQTSEDNLFRIYSWDTELGGTMHDFENIFQYKSGDTVFSKLAYDTATIEEGDYVPFYSDIFTFKNNGKSYYLAISNGIYSNKDISQSIKIFCIENGLLNDTIKLIKTSTNLTNEIYVSYDFFSVVDRPERPVKLIKYDSATKKIYIPIVLENGKVTDRFIIYQFTGQYFEKVMTQKSNNSKQ